MEDLVSRLKACKLPETMGTKWDRYSDAIAIDDRWVDFANDDCAGSALFIVRGLKALNGKGFDQLNLAFNREAGDWSVNGWHSSLPEGDPYLALEECGPTMAQAVAEALIQAFTSVGTQGESVEITGGKG